jgi:hypothetical protein
MLSASLLLALAAFAADQIHVLQNPRVAGHLLAGDSDENGACRALGFERGVPGSAELEEFEKDGWKFTLKISREGHGAQFGYSDTDGGYFFSKLACLNKRRDLPGERNVLARRPTYPGSRMVFSASSDRDGVCKALGHEKFAGAEILSADAVGQVVAVDREGRVAGGDYLGDQDGFWIFKLVCLTKECRR